MNITDPDERSARAGEYVLGVLPARERADFEAQLARDATLERAVYAWQDRLLEVAPVPAPLAPAPDLWARIARDIERLAPPAAARSAERAPRAPWWSSLSFWRGLSAVAAAAALVLAWLLLLAPAPSTERYVAVLLAPDNRAAWIVEADRREVRLKPLLAVRAGPRQSLQFWTKPEGAAGPTSLGVLPADGAVVLPADRLPGLGANQLFEVTLEPEYGSPTGRPTGPVLAIGRAAKI